MSVIMGRRAMTTVVIRAVLMRTMVMRAVRMSSNTKTGVTTVTWRAVMNTIGKYCNYKVHIITTGHVNTNKYIYHRVKHHMNEV